MQWKKLPIHYIFEHKEIFLRQFGILPVKGMKIIPSTFIRRPLCCFSFSSIAQSSIHIIYYHRLERYCKDILRCDRKSECKNKQNRKCVASIKWQTRERENASASNMKLIKLPPWCRNTQASTHAHTFIKSTFVSLFHFILFVSDAIGGGGGDGDGGARHSHSQTIKIFWRFFSFFLLHSFLYIYDYRVYWIGFLWCYSVVMGDICCLVEWMIFPILWPLLKTKMNIHTYIRLTIHTHGIGSE